MLNTYASIQQQFVDTEGKNPTTENVYKSIKHTRGNYGLRINGITCAWRCSVYKLIMNYFKGE